MHIHLVTSSAGKRTGTPIKGLLIAVLVVVVVEQYEVEVVVGQSDLN